MSAASTTATKWYFKKGFLLTVGAGAVPLSLYSYDRYQCKKTHDRYMNVAKTYGEVPLPVHQLPLKITIIAEGRDRDDLLAQNEKFMGMVQPLLTAAGVDYEWIDGSRKKHAVEYVKHYQERVSTALARKKEEETTVSATASTLPTEESAVLLFKGISEWRLAHWLENDLLAIVSSTSGTIAGRPGFLSRLASWFWPFSRSSSAPSSSSQSVVPVPSTAPIGADVKSLSESPQAQMERELIEKVKSELLPPGVTNVFSYQQGVIAVGTSVFRDILEAYRQVHARRPQEWDAVFGASKVRTGYLPIPTIDSSDSRLLSRLWRFFNKRHDMLACSEAALGIISDSLEVWTESHDSMWPSKYEPAAAGPLADKLLLYKPTQLPRSNTGVSA